VLEHHGLSVRGRGRAARAMAGGAYLLGRARMVGHGRSNASRTKTALFFDLTEILKWNFPT